MGCRIIVGHQNSGLGAECAIFYCSTSDTIFGPIMSDLEEAESFMKWLPGDPRAYDDEELSKLYTEFLDWRNEDE